MKHSVLLLLLLLLPIQDCHGQNPETSLHSSEEDVSKENPDNVNEPTPDPTKNSRIKREGGSYEDTTNYSYFPKCGNLEMRYSRKCFCGNETLMKIDTGDSMCCLPPDANCSYTTAGYNGDKRDSDVHCPDGVAQSKLKPCHGECFNDYEKSSKLFIQSHQHCSDLNVCINIQNMCSGLCNSDPDTCVGDLRCFANGYPEENDWNDLETLITEYVDNHKYCKKSYGENNHEYNQLTREDETEIKPGGDLPLDLSLLVPCTDKRGNDGYLCDNNVDDDNKCTANTNWCDGSGASCEVGNITISLDNPQLCANQTKLSELSCDLYTSAGQLFAHGLRCSGKNKACFFPFYNHYNGEPLGAKPTCDDNSHKKFPVGVTCSKFNQQFMVQHKQQWCNCTDDTNPNCIYAKGSKICTNPEAWLEEQRLNQFVQDPHQCQSSCEVPGKDCQGTKNCIQFYLMFIFKNFFLIFRILFLINF